MHDLTRTIVHEDVRRVPVPQSQYMPNYRSCGDTPGVIQSYCEPSSWRLVQLGEVVSHYWFEPFLDVRKSFQE